MPLSDYTIDPQRDLILERIIDVPRELVWKAWTMPEHITKWFTPAPYTTPECEIDLRPGGLFRTVMQSPEGERHDNIGCYLEVVENERLAWTDALHAGYRPANKPNDCINSYLTAILLLDPHGKNGTKYTVLARHAFAESARKHEEMGFSHGWGAALDQLVAMVKTW